MIAETAIEMAIQPVVKYMGDLFSKENLRPVRVAACSLLGMPELTEDEKWDEHWSKFEEHQLIMKHQGQ